VTKLHAGLNALFLKLGRVGGTEEYVRRLLEALEQEAADEVALTLFVNRRFASSLAETTAASLAVVPVSGDSPALRIAIESTWLAREAARRSVDVVHHLGNTIPHVRTRPAVVTIHDIQAIVRPGDFGRIKGAYLRRRLRSAALGSRVVTTPSAHVRGQVIDRFGVDEGRVVVVPAPIIAAPTVDETDGSPFPGGVEAPFLLYPAITHPHKNHVTLLRAFAAVASSDPSLSLVLTGGEGAAASQVRREIDSLDLDRRVHLLGRIPRPDLDRLLRGAVALIFPSRHEGYGLPVAEAMALGCPVIASDAAAVPEVVGDAGLLVDPDDVDGWIGAISSVLGNEDLRSRLVARGREQVASLSPERTARRLVDAYRIAAGAGNGV
jgi:glycosyltransferase involved in cell wall biosynthesis